MPLTDLAFWRNRWSTVQRAGKAYGTNVCWSGAEYKRELAAIEGALAPIIPDAPEHGSVLDYGCAEARFAPMLQKKGWHYIGADLFPEILTEAGRQQPTGHFVLSDDAKHIHADLLFLSLVLQHFADADAVALLRSLPGREVIVLDDTNRDSSYVKARDGKALVRILSLAGFDDPMCVEFASPKCHYKILRASRKVAG